MSIPRLDHIVPSFKVGKFQNFRIVGSGYSLDDGTGGVAAITVGLTDANGVFKWTLAATTPVLVDDKTILVRAKPVRVVAAADDDPFDIDDEHALGSGDLTITVTNGDGSATPQVHMIISYDETADT